MKGPINEVRDRPAELWIKFLGFVAIVTVPLISVIGYMVIDELKEQNQNQKEMSRELSNINGHIKTFVSEIAALKNDVENISIRVDGNTREIYKLKGAK
jgi:peptidoglycan hydrolase CwlO-like protein